MSWINDDSRLFLSRGYLDAGQTVESRIRVIAETAEGILKKPGFADEIEGYILKGWISLSSPIWSNFGTGKGLPISCNNSYFEDSIEDILFKVAEVGEMTKQGAGTSAYLGAIRPRGAPISTGGVADGPVHYMRLIETTADVISQSNVRRGSCAAYLDVEHPDILEFLHSREEGAPIQHLSLGVCIGDAWMQAMIDGDRAKRTIWARILRKRAETGYPYLFFKDAVNRGAPQVYKDKGRTIWSSNLCSEICLSSSDDESFVCDLASLNALHYRAWKGTRVVRALVELLDAVMTEYIAKIEAMGVRAFRHMESAYNFAKRQRAIGIGVLGWHSLLQSEMIPFESIIAKLINVELFKHIRDEALEASREMAATHGEPEMLEGYGQRHVTLMAVAPTTSSSFILGQVSPSIEPENSNYYTKDLQKGKFTYKNPYLKRLLAEKDLDQPEIWHAILLAGGSVQGLDVLSDAEKAVFKTFGEVSQMDIIIQAAQRTKFIDQSQSLNLMIHPSESPKAINEMMIEGWRLGLKTLYHQRSTNPSQEYARSLVTCSSCEA